MPRACDFGRRSPFCHVERSRRERSEHRRSRNIPTRKVSAGGRDSSAFATAQGRNDNACKRLGSKKVTDSRSNSRSRSDTVFWEGPYGNLKSTVT